MKRRTPLAVAVVGALLVGGATTGTTLAAWQDGAAVAASQVESGTIELTVEGQVDASLGSLSNLALNQGSTPGAARSVSATLANAGAGKNLRLQVALADISTTAPALNDGLEVAVSSAATEAACPSSPVSAFEALSATNAHALTTAALPPTGTVAVCVFVRVEGGAGTAVQNVSGDLVLTFTGEQVRP